ncbi:MAG: hypothetical protein LUC89_01640, partial [Oscillospiraceae bacterium]|nr:hypothetical protein [Oscillospiraceae bacterium]
VYTSDSEGTVLYFNLSNGSYSGDLYNATGWYHSETWGQEADTLNLVIDNAELSGAISVTKSVHAVAYYEGIEDAIEAQSAINAEYGYDPIQYVYLDEALEIVEDAEDAAYVQFTYYTKLQYWVLGHLINTPTDEGNAVVNVTLQNGAVWNVTDACYITTLTVDDTSSVNGVITEIDGGYLVEPLSASGEASGQ